METVSESLRSLREDPRGASRQHGIEDPFAPTNKGGSNAVHIVAP
jgi:hypothetical protein